jgi:hypothetical protein
MGPPGLGLAPAAAQPPAVAEPEVLLPPKPALESAENALGPRAWVNVALSMTAAALALVAFDFLAHPRLPDSWLVGGGLTLAAIVGTALGWLMWVAGDDVRDWVRRRLRERAVTIGLACALVALGALLLLLLRNRPVVLRVVPGTRLAFLLPKLGEDPGPTVFALHIWQGPSTVPAWSIAVLHQPGVAAGASQRVVRVVLARAKSQIVENMTTYLSRVAERYRDDWRKAWNPPADELSKLDKVVRRSGENLRFELLANGKPVALERLKIIPLTESIEETIEVVFLEPADVP